MTRRRRLSTGASPFAAAAVWLAHSPEGAASPSATTKERRAVRVLVADQHEATRTGTKAALEASGFVVVAECCDADDAIASARRTLPAICLVDLGLPGGGLAAAATIASLPSRPRVVAVGASADDEDLFAALAAGVAGFLLKDVGW